MLEKKSNSRKKNNRKTRNRNKKKVRNNIKHDIKYHKNGTSDLQDRPQYEEPELKQMLIEHVKCTRQEICFNT